MGSMGRICPPPEGYKKIRVHLIFDVIKHDAHYKARCVADHGHLIDVPINSIYSGVVLLCSLHTITFLSELNDLEMWATDIGNAYLPQSFHQQEALYHH